MKVKNIHVWLILVFAALHFFCCISCRALKVADEHVLTLLTIAMIFILCYWREMKIFSMISAVIIVNVMAYLTGNSLPKLLTPLMGETVWVYATSTFVTTLVLGFSFEFVMNLLSKGRKERQNFRQRWIVHLNDRIVPVKTEQIAYFFSENKSNYLVADDGNKYLIDSTIESIERDLDPAAFFRINRGSIVALSAIDSAKKKAGRYVVEVHPALGLNMVVARSRVDAFLAWLAR
ncbi:MAG: LytTR family transcriptional regulator [Bacteroidales bacterium]|nr:LytTR family transcriptional regulator [Bacteroidales bacterium]